MVARNDGKLIHLVSPTEVADIPISALAPKLDWSLMSETEHFVQLYESDQFLIDSLGGYVASALGAGERCIVVATKEHRDELDTLLHAAGVDVPTERASGQYVVLDAGEVLSRFMINGYPSAEHFASVVGGLKY